MTTCESMSDGVTVSFIPEELRQPAREVCKPGAQFPEALNMPNVLVIGDSIASGYVPFVRRELEGMAQTQLSPWLYQDNPFDGAGEPGYFAMCAGRQPKKNQSHWDIAMSLSPSPNHRQVL